MNPKEIIHKDWYSIVNLLYQEPLRTLSAEILPNISYQPKAENIFKVFEVPINSIKVVILGQDPYPTPGNAIGRAFAVSETTKIPVSLKNIQTEIYESGQLSDMVINANQWKTLEHWQEQGVFLLNTALTVETGKAGSHLKYWEEFIKRAITLISLEQPCIWLLWGQKAKNFLPYIVKNKFNVDLYNEETIKMIPITDDYNYILTAPHPAAEAYSGGKAGFFGSNHFYYVNSILKNKKLKEIKW